jgi:hypothetical protein
MGCSVLVRRWWREASQITTAMTARTSVNPAIEAWGSAKSPSSRLLNNPPIGVSSGHSTTMFVDQPVRGRVDHPEPEQEGHLADRHVVPRGRASAATSPPAESCEGATGLSVGQDGEPERRPYRGRGFGCIL